MNVFYSMSRDNKSLDNSSIDAILKGLTSRPNVQSTLILSRKDGSIIRTTGFTQMRKNSNVGSRMYFASQPDGDIALPVQGVTGSTEVENSAEHKEEQPSAAQSLASVIYEFVNVGSRLASSIAQSATDESLTTTERGLRPGAQLQEQDHNQSTANDEEDMQLIRMRTKKQEIIIFPDPNYLCCVVQTLAKHAP